MEVGRVVSVGFAAVKGTRWLERDAIDLTPAGVDGDRRWCFVDVVRRQVLRTVADPVLVRLEAAPDPEPTDETLTCDYWGRPVALRLVDDPLAARASALLGRPVRLAQAPPGAVVYGGGVSLVGAASLAAHDAEPARVRAAVVVDAGPTAYDEERWIGRELTLGTAAVRPTTRTPRCRVVDHHPRTGDRDRTLLRDLGARGEPVLGLDGDVVAPGRVRPGDPVHLVGPA